MRLFYAAIFGIAVLTFFAFQKPADVYMTKTGSVSFISKAQLEEIEADNGRVHAVLNRTDKTVSFEVPIQAFEGFNSKLQREHFNENYLESERFEHATFKGKVIETVDLTKDGTYKVRAKGLLTIHGIEVERIIPGSVTVAGDKVKIKAEFEVGLADHDIKTPRIVNQKIAEVVNVSVEADLVPDQAW